MESQTLAASPRHNGWTADKQARFIDALAETGSVTSAALGVFMTPRSAYYLRSRPEAEAFATAWDMALQRAGGKLLSVAFQRALEGNVRRIWKDGMLVLEDQQPSDRLLVWLLNRIGPGAFRGATADAPLATQAELDEQRALFTNALPDFPSVTNADLFETPTRPNRDDE